VAIPYAEDLIRPLLNYAGDCQEHSFDEAVDALAKQCGLTEEERKALRPDGRTPVFRNRVGWARMYLYKARLVASDRRSYFTITERGIDVLRDGPPRITQKFLLQFPEYAVFKGSRRREHQDGKVETSGSTGRVEDIPPKRPLSFTDAAEYVLQHYAGSNPMHYRDVTAKALELGLVKTQGQTPEATLYAQILTEIERRTRQGNAPRFTKLGKGLIGLSRWAESGLAAQIELHNREARRKLLMRLGSLPPVTFEELIAQLLVALGFQEVTVTNRSGDGGIDVRGTLVVGDVIRTRMAVHASVLRVVTTYLRFTLVRWDKKAENYLGLLKLACGLLWFRRYSRLAPMR
jgi:restriction endonuclease Mrr